MSKKKHILITGANSFIGSYFKANAKNYVVDEVCVKDNKVSELKFKGYDTIFHVAAIVHQTSKLPDSIYYQVNSTLAYEVAKKAKEDGVKHFVFMSTAKVYGENSSVDNPWFEDSKCFPSDAYGKSKLDAEQKITSLEDKDFTVSIIRTPVVYGAHVRGNIERMAQYIKATRIIPLKGIDNKRAMVFIGNLVAMIYRIIDLQKSGIFLASDRRAISTSDFAQYMINATNQKKLFIAIPCYIQRSINLITPRIYHRVFGSMVLNNEKTFKELDFYPPYTVEYGIQEVMDYIVKHFKLKNRFFSF